MVKVKICGITNLEDALVAVEAGADALGFNFYPKSPRYIEPGTAGRIIQTLPPFIASVGIFVNAERNRVEEIIKETRISVLQFHGNEKPEGCQFDMPVIKAVSVGFSVEALKAYREICGVLLDSPHRGSFGGMGEVFDWTEAEKYKILARPIIISGGLGPENVEEAIQKVSPYGVDACSRLEKEPGKKNHQYVRQFITRAKSVNRK
ncbi:MAG: phosphoribosylanthranilate isomerase [Chlamydiae bacterium]|nr:phosphoribosylanthranilate isomerase [Chlamydiota bacterium]MBI3277070.1 phosphoribosylanthranilate isomerase [Chlamydiota bacterium]